MPEQEEGFVVVEKRIPDVYRQHALLDEATTPFANYAGHLVVSELAKSLDWRLSLWRPDGEPVHTVLLAESREQSHATLVRVVRDRVAAMFSAPSQP
jgi:hypothetical protein